MNNYHVTDGFMDSKGLKIASNAANRAKVIHKNMHIFIEYCIKAIYLAKTVNNLIKSKSIAIIKKRLRKILKFWHKRAIIFRIVILKVIFTKFICR